MTICQREAKAAGWLYPGSCPTCQFGPCPRDPGNRRPDDETPNKVTAVAEAPADSAAMIADVVEGFERAYGRKPRHVSLVITKIVGSASIATRVELE